MHTSVYRCISRAIAPTVALITDPSFNYLAISWVKFVQPLGHASPILPSLSDSYNFPRLDAGSLITLWPFTWLGVCKLKVTALLA